LKRYKAFIGRRFTGRNEGNVPIMALRNVLVGGAFAKFVSDGDSNGVLSLARQPACAAADPLRSA
jgi:hypothetical protein